MDQVVEILIWVGSVLGGLTGIGTIWGAVVWIARRAESRQASALLGAWYGYAFYEGRRGPIFYREKITIARGVLPWRFLITSIPITDGETSAYKGHVRVRAPFLYSATREPVYEDRTFEISRRIMDERHSADLMVGLHIGRSYEETVHAACAYVWSKVPLDPAATSIRSPDPAVEEEKFLEIVRDYFEVDPASFQLKMR